jgi:hypothetical protein
MAFKGRMMSLQIMHDVPLVFLWCIWRACDACGGACGFSALTFFRFPILLTTYQHLKPFKSFMCIWMNFKGLMMTLQIMHDVPVVCLWCIWHAGDACRFSGLPFSRIPISLTTYQHLKALQIIHMYLNGLQRSYDVPTDHAWCACDVPVHGPLKLRTKHGGDNSRSLWRNCFQLKCVPRIQRRRKIMHTKKILAQLLISPRSYSLPKSTRYTVVKSQFLGLQLSRQILSVCDLCLFSEALWFPESGE